jgi:hypothetical protein
MSIVTSLLAGGPVGYATSHFSTNPRNEAIAFDAAVGMLGAASSTPRREVCEWTLSQ